MTTLSVLGLWVLAGVVVAVGLRRAEPLPACKCHDARAAEAETNWYGAHECRPG